MISKNRHIPEFRDEPWLWKHAFISDVTHHLNDLSPILQGKYHMVHEMLCEVTSFKAK